MSLLVGLPLKLFSILFAVVRLAWPVVLILLILWFIRHRKGEKAAPTAEKTKEPTFDGPVYTVDYEEVKEE